MSYRHSARYGASALETEQRRLQREPVAVWKQQWVAPSNAPPQSSQAGIKILKWIKTPEVVRFDEEEGIPSTQGLGDETMMSVSQAAPIGDIAPPDASATGSVDISAAHTPAPQETGADRPLADTQDAGDETMMSVSQTQPSDGAPLPDASASASWNASATHTPGPAEADVSAVPGASDDLASVPLTSSSMSDLPSLPAIPGESTGADDRQSSDLSQIPQSSSLQSDLLGIETQPSQSQLLTQASLPSSDAMDRPSTQDDLASSQALGSSAPIAPMDVAEPADLQQGVEEDARAPVTIDMPRPRDDAEPDAPTATQQEQEDAKEAAMAAQAEMEAQQGGTNDGSLPAEEFLPSTADP